MLVIYLLPIIKKGVQSSTHALSSFGGNETPSAQRSQTRSLSRRVSFPSLDRPLFLPHRVSTFFFQSHNYLGNRTGSTTRQVCQCVLHLRDSLGSVEGLHDEAGFGVCLAGTCPFLGLGWRWNFESSRYGISHPFTSLF